MTDNSNLIIENNNKRQSYARRIAHDAFSNLGARLGLAWILVLVVVAVFAPLLANSHPYLISIEGAISSPLYEYLTAADIILLFLFIMAVLLYFFKWSTNKKFVVFIASGIVVSTISFSFVDTPELAIYQKYRDLDRANKVEWVINAPIPYSPKDYLRDVGDTSLEEPLTAGLRTHWFGTEENGSDVLSRMIHASRIALGIGFVATGIAMIIGVIIGGLMGYFSGTVDMIGMRLVEIFEAIPTLFLLLTFVAFFGRSLYLMMVIIGITTWPGYARYVRAEFFRLRKMDFVQSAIVAGLPLRSILFRHMLPNGFAPVMVAASFGVASAILYEAILSFLGLGLIDNPSWGEMLNQAVQAASFHWWMAFFPGFAIFLTVFAYNLIGESLRDAVDPYLNKK